MGKKKYKSKYDAVETLKQQIFPVEYEELIQDLYDKACRGSSQLWDKITNADDLIHDSQFKKDFYASANKGMNEAQDCIISIIQGSDKIDYPQELLLRGIADAIAWQLLGQQLCYGRRFFKAVKQPDLYNCNFDSVVFAAKELRKDKPDSVPLISDLTSFIQVGDLLMFEPEKGIRLCEVKEGEMNSKIGEFMNFYISSRCDRSLFYFTKKEGTSALKQLQRMFRQASRMSHVSKVLSTGIGVDPDTQDKIYIPEQFFEITTWDDRLESALEKSDEESYVIDVIDNCLFLGIYSSEHMRKGGHIAFNLWFDGCGGSSDCPRVSLLDSMKIPLALPIFSRCIPDKYKFDILFGRKHVCMAISIDGLLNECIKEGLQVRFATKKERGRLDNTSNKPFKYKGEVIFIGNGKTEFAIMDGIFLRILFHGQRAISLIKVMLDSAGDINKGDVDLDSY